MTRQRVTTHNANGYSHGCRCDTCKTGHNARMRAYFQGRGGNPYRKTTPKVTCAGGCGRMLRGGTCRYCTPAMKARRARRARCQAKLDLAALGSRGERPWVHDSCGECGSGFLRRDGDVPFCSSKCRRREARGRRRALEAGRKVTPGRRYAVHERDNWTCRLCGFPVKRDAIVPDLEAPVIDHIVSLARGGDHGEANWQTAHFLCNSYKRDLDMSEVA